MQFSGRFPSEQERKLFWVTLCLLWRERASVLNYRTFQDFRKLLLPFFSSGDKQAHTTHRARRWADESDQDICEKGDGNFCWEFRRTRESEGRLWFLFFCRWCDRFTITFNDDFSHRSLPLLSGVSNLPAISSHGISLCFFLADLNLKIIWFPMRLDFPNHCFS